MTFTSVRARSVALACSLSALLLSASTVELHADEAKKAATNILMTQDLTGVANKEGIMLTVEYPPGGSSAPHRHDAHVFVYVVEGSLRMGVAGQEPVTLKPGETFYESPTDIHNVSANASKTEPVKFLVFIVKDKGKPVSSAVDENSAK